MDKKNFNILVVLASVILLIGASGCEQTEDKKSSTSTGGTTDSFIGKVSEGLDIKFMGGAPPTEVYDSNYEFGINIRLENIGEYNINDEKAKVKIIGIDPVDFGKESKDFTQSVKGGLISARKDPQGNDVAGGITNIDFAGLQAKNVTGNVPYTIRAEICYPYGTKTVSQVCILEDLLGTTRKAGEEPFCKPTGDRTYENSGAPVQVTAVKQSATAKDKVSISFDIEHQAKGLIYGLGTDCNSVLSNKNKVRVKVKTGMNDLECSGLGKADPTTKEVVGSVTLYGEGGKEKRTIVCTQSLPDGTRVDSEKQVMINLEYDYQYHVDTQLVVKHTGD